MEYKKFYEDKPDSYFSLSRPEMLKYVAPGVKSVLDVGCSNGAFGKGLKDKFGCEVWGIEPDTASFKEAYTKLDNTFNALFDESLNLEGKKFDYIIYNDVLEHILYPIDILQLSKKHLNPNGKIIASIPNFRHIENLIEIVWNKEFQYKDHGILDKTHLRFYTKKSIIKMFNSAEYKVVLIEGINTVFWDQKKLSLIQFIMNTITLNRMNDCQYLQFAIVAEPLN